MKALLQGLSSSVGFDLLYTTEISWGTAAQPYTRAMGEILRKSDSQSHFQSADSVKHVYSKYGYDNCKTEKL